MKYNSYKSKKFLNDVSNMVIKYNNIEKVYDNIIHKYIYVHFNNLYVNKYFQQKNLTDDLLDKISLDIYYYINNNEDECDYINKTCKIYNIFNEKNLTLKKFIRQMIGRYCIVYFSYRDDYEYIKSIIDLYKIYDKLNTPFKHTYFIPPHMSINLSQLEHFIEKYNKIEKIVDNIWCF